MTVIFGQRQGLLHHIDRKFLLCVLKTLLPHLGQSHLHTSLALRLEGYHSHLTALLDQNPPSLFEFLTQPAEEFAQGLLSTKNLSLLERLELPPCYRKESEIAFATGADALDPVAETDMALSHGGCFLQALEVVARQEDPLLKHLAEKARSHLAKFSSFQEYVLDTRGLS